MEDLYDKYALPLLQHPDQSPHDTVLSILDEPGNEPFTPADPSPINDEYAARLYVLMRDLLDWLYETNKLRFAADFHLVTQDESAIDVYSGFYLMSKNNTGPPILTKNEFGQFSLEWNHVFEFDHSRDSIEPLTSLFDEQHPLGHHLVIMTSREDDSKFINFGTDGIHFFDVIPVEHTNIERLHRPLYNVRFSINISTLAGMFLQYAWSVARATPTMDIMQYRDDVWRTWNAVREIPLTVRNARQAKPVFLLTGMMVSVMILLGDFQQYQNMMQAVFTKFYYNWTAINLALSAHARDQRDVIRSAGLMKASMITREMQVESELSDVMSGTKPLMMAFYMLYQRENKVPSWAFQLKLCGMDVHQLMRVFVMDFYDILMLSTKPSERGHLLVWRHADEIITNTHGANDNVPDYSDDRYCKVSAEQIAIYRSRSSARYKNLERRLVSTARVMYPE